VPRLDAELGAEPVGEARQAGGLHRRDVRRGEGAPRVALGAAVDAAAEEPPRVEGADRVGGVDGDDDRRRLVHDPVRRSRV
jgi:hypothetical protein